MWQWIWWCDNDMMMWLFKSPWNMFDLAIGWIRWCDNEYDHVTMNMMMWLFKSPWKMFDLAIVLAKCCHINQTGETPPGWESTFWALPYYGRRQRRTFMFFGTIKPANTVAEYDDVTMDMMMWQTGLEIHQEPVEHVWSRHCVHQPHLFRAVGDGLCQVFPFFFLLESQ